MSKPLGILAAVVLVCSLALAGCGNKDDEAPTPGGPAVGAATPGGGTITSTPITGKPPHMRR